MRKVGDSLCSNGESLSADICSFILEQVIQILEINFRALWWRRKLTVMSCFLVLFLKDDSISLTPVAWLCVCFPTSARVPSRAFTRISISVSGGSSPGACSTRVLSLLLLSWWLLGSVPAGGWVENTVGTVYYDLKDLSMSNQAGVSY